MYATTPRGIANARPEELRALAERLCFALEALIVEGGPEARRDAKSALEAAGRGTSSKS